MAPSNPKRPPRPPRPPGAAASKKEDVELPFDDDEVAPLQEDDPRPQRVPQFPAGSRRTGARRTGVREGTKDRELATRFDTQEYSDPGYVLAFLYVEKGPGAGQLMPVKQGPLIIGRASACDLRLQHPSISRRHAQLMRQGERFTLRDLGSQNGTFVNRIKLSADQEIVVGDEISLGNAVLKLRGPGAPAEKEAAPSVVTETRTAPASHTRRRMSLSRVALIAAAVGSGVAALLTLAFLKFSGPAQRSPSPAPAPSTESATPPEATAPAPQATEYVPPPSANEEEQTAAPQEEVVAEESPRALKPLKPSQGPRASSVSAKPLASRKGTKASTKAATARSEDSAPSSAAEKAPAPAAAPVSRDAVLSLYESGDVAGALNLARSGQLEPLTKKLSEFQNARDAAQKALDAKDSARAIQNLATALAVDQELSQGWAKHVQAIRRQVGKLYTQLGQDQLKAKDKAAARESFEMALKYDPSNTWAKTELQQLNGK
ncbi:FHA domain containing protein [Hyalangium minutum]|uniref:FHA domain containing protein n=1 Tax=Hyalangium minutum TaxID=394096 RepID=A0A085WA95_9BACT|nr:FHA domain containing protein [Hyalangium minutum]